MLLIAKKSFHYKSRRLQPGDEFDAKPLDAKILIAVGKARDPNDRPRGVVKPPPPELVEAIPELSAEPARSDEDREIDDLRVEAAALGVHVDGRWGEARLRQEILAAKIIDAVQS